MKNKIISPNSSFGILVTRTSFFDFCKFYVLSFIIAQLVETYWFHPDRFKGHDYKYVLYTLGNSFAESFLNFFIVFVVIRTYFLYVQRKDNNKTY